MRMEMLPENSGEHFCQTKQQDKGKIDDMGETMATRSEERLAR